MYPVYAILQTLVFNEGITVVSSLKDYKFAEINWSEYGISLEL